MWSSTGLNCKSSYMSIAGVQPMRRCRVEAMVDTQRASNLQCVEQMCAVCGAALAVCGALLAVCGAHWQCVEQHWQCVEQHWQCVEQHWQCVEHYWQCVEQHWQCVEQHWQCEGVLAVQSNTHPKLIY